MNKKKFIGKTVLFAALGAITVALISKNGRKKYLQGYKSGYTTAELDFKEEQDDLDFQNYCMQDKLASCRQKISRLREINDAYRCECITMAERCKKCLDKIAENKSISDTDSKKLKACSKDFDEFLKKEGK